MNTFCMVGEHCPIAYACVHHLNAVNTKARERIDAQLITPHGEWATGACAEFQKAEDATCSPSC